MIFFKSLQALSVAGVIFAITANHAEPLWAASKLDNAIYADLLEKYVDKGHVNYAGFKAEESRLDEYLALMAQIDPDQLSRDEQFAFYANAYNAWTIKLILKHYPGISSIKEAGGIFSSPWKQEIARIDGQLMTLDHIEHDILRPVYKDPRVHFAINCAALSCPPLGSEPFSGETLDQQLDTLTRQFINNSESNYLDGNTLRVSRIFKWFGEDFDDNILDFFLTYADGDFKAALEARKTEIRVKYLDYDWSLNGR